MEKLTPTLKTMDAAWQSSELAMGDYLESLYESYLQNPQSVDAEWQAYFAGLQAKLQGPKDQAHAPIREKFIHLAQKPSLLTQASGADSRLIGALNLLEAYRAFGHRWADLDPLQLATKPQFPRLTLAYHGLSDQDLSFRFELPGLGEKTLQDWMSFFKAKYCGHLAFEYRHMASDEAQDWIRHRIEVQGLPVFNQDQKKQIYQQLVAADGLEKYLGMKFVGQKRFSLEGGDSLVPGLCQMITQAAGYKVQEVLIGMAHRGRLNVLVNVVGKAPAELFSEFEGTKTQDLLSGDVKYHNGFGSRIKTPAGEIHTMVAFNPSHLEIVSPVVGGVARARKNIEALEAKAILPVLLHGDAAFTGQGVVAEYFNMSQTRAFGVGGSIHIVINNQVGFTTDPTDARSAPYCTDIAKMIDAFILHVNGNDPEAVVSAFQLALDYRQKFARDVVIDLQCYRLHGHNEADEPSGTQPLMYQRVKAQKAPHVAYGAKLVEAGVLRAEDLEAQIQAYRKDLESGKPVVALADKSHAYHLADWKKYREATWQAQAKTGFDAQKFVALAERVNSLPDGFTLQAQVGKTIADRQKMTAGELPINWGYAEMMAYATLLEEGYGVRLIGQDVGRGTFSHRHAVWHDFQTGQLHLSLKALAKAPAQVEVLDSVLSEEAVMAFEYGYACTDPNALVIWEGQFGDFANGAQVVIDQFISSGEEKWGLLSNLVLFLPHGYEGMGAEHSSARLERFLQLCAHDNMQVCVPTTPAQHFHLIRRQMVRQYRKPLVVMTPKSLLRHPLVISTLEDLTQGQFQPVLDEIDPLKPAQIQRVVFCQGKVYYDLLIQRRELKMEHVAIVRLEQLYPYPTEALQAVIQKYAHAKEWIFCQEEPENQGAWWKLYWFLKDLIPTGRTLQYAGRARFAAPAAGYPELHKKQQQALVSEALGSKKV